MTISRRGALKLGLSASTLPLLGGSPLSALAEAHSDDSAAARDNEAIRARPLPLQDVRLTGGPLKHAQELDARYLLELEPDRMLALHRERAGLRRKAEPYGGWDGGGRNLTGHICGHYLSAVSLMYAATGDPRFRDRSEYIVRELKEVQDAHGDGYLYAPEGGREMFARLAKGEVKSASFDLNGQWVPWYTLHKTFAGLRDAHRHTANRAALEVEVALARWADGVLSGLGDAQVQAMLNTEHGGMAEVLVDLYADTGDVRWLNRSLTFEHRAFLEPLQRHHDNLAGKHGNTSVPKMVGSAERFLVASRAADLEAATFYWDTVVRHHSFSSGGHGKDEFFGPADRIADMLEGRTAESCNVYNMLKLTRKLFSVRPDAHYADFQERALFNHVLASMDPEDGRTCYMVPVGQGVEHEYHDMQHDFTCCVGTGMENHALHGDGIYWEAKDRLWVNVYAPSTAIWSAAGAHLTMDTDFPEGESARLTIRLRAPKQLTLALRRPHWAEGFTVSVNGELIPPPAPTAQVALVGPSQYADGMPNVSSYVELTRTWRSGDLVEVKLPKSLRIEPTPDNPGRVSLLWGPLVLAGDLGPETGRHAPDPVPARRGAAPVKVPVFVVADRPDRRVSPVGDWLEPAGAAGTFRTDGVGREPDADGREHDVEFVPFYRLHRRTYSTYWDLLSPEDWAARKAEYQAEAERLRKLEAATVAFVSPGDPESDNRFAYRGGEDSAVLRLRERAGRAGRSWFSYTVPIERTHPMTLVVTYFSDDRRLPASFDIVVDGQSLGPVRLERARPGRFYDVEYAIPAGLLKGKDQLTVRFQAAEGSQIATVFGLRMVRGDAVR